MTVDLDLPADVVALARPLSVLTDSPDPAAARRAVVPAGEWVEFRATDDSTVVYVCSADASRWDLAMPWPGVFGVADAGEALVALTAPVPAAERAAVPDGPAAPVSPAPAVTAPASMPAVSGAVRARVLSVERRQQSGSGWRAPLEALCVDLRRTGQGSRAADLERAAGKPGRSPAYGAFSDCLRAWARVDPSR